MQLTPATAAEVHRIFDDPTLIVANDEADETRFVDAERYGAKAPRLTEVRAPLALASDPTGSPESL